LSAGRILVIDDEPQIRRIMRETLVSAGYEVDDAKNGAEGLEKIREFRPDLVLLDINMPDIGGVEVCKAIRSDSNIAIIMLTGRKSQRDKVAALDAGADDFCHKAFQHAGSFGSSTCRTPSGTTDADIRHQNALWPAYDRLRRTVGNARIYDFASQAKGTRLVTLSDVTRK
jgi:CheY-like chemotaxis protein